MEFIIILLIAAAVIITAIAVVLGVAADAISWMRDLRDSWRGKDVPYNGWGGSI
ncbi:MAG: hypothetical protein Q8L89_09390 [Gammaproteobacteria bacterium]|nr:hypothetical protein [Gammaproteobacteria bacterium]